MPYRQSESETQTPLVSVITPTFNHEAYIQSCINSVSDQTFRAWEQLIIDDGSTDATVRLVQKYCDDRIRCLKQEHQGVEKLAMTYNRALSEVRGELVAILEGDDVWPPEKLSRMISAFENPEVVLAYGEVLDIDSNGTVSKRTPRSYKRRTKVAESILFNDPVGTATPLLLTHAGQSFIQPVSVMIRRTALESIGGFHYVPGQCSPDVPTFVRLSRKGKFAYFPEVVGFRRRHLGSATIKYLSVMSPVARKYALTAYSDPAFELTTEQQEYVRKSWDGASHKAAFSQGRTALANREWVIARRQFLSAIKSAEGRTVFAGFVGWVFSWFHADLEGVFEIAGRATLSRKPRRMQT